MNYKELLKNALQRQKELVTAAQSGNRDMTPEETREFEELQGKINQYQTAIAEEEARQQAIAEERQRCNEINALCRDFNMDPNSYIQNGTSVSEVRDAILDDLRAHSTPVSVSAREGQVTVTEDEQDKVRAAMSDGLLMRSGMAVENPAPGANDFRGMSLRDMAVECLSREGKNTNELLRMSKDDLYAEMSRQFMNPTAAFPAILDSSIKKVIVEEYRKVETTFELFTTKGSVTDFKPTPDHEYLLGGVGDFEIVPENGELKHSKPQTALLPQRKVDTYGKQFSMSRQAFINDDVGFLTETPKAYTIAAKRTIDKNVYKILCGNPAIFDGTALFHANHKNLIGSGAAPSQQTIQDIILLAQEQKNQFEEPIYVIPRALVVPVGYEFKLATIFHSAQVVGSANNDINPLYNYPLKTVQSPWINMFSGANAKPWFMATDPASSKGIQVDYLNGKETPTFRRSEPAGQLGFVWDIWLDWGITVRDYRGIYKNPGVA